MKWIIKTHFLKVNTEKPTNIQLYTISVMLKGNIHKEYCGKIKQICCAMCIQGNVVTNLVFPLIVDLSSLLSDKIYVLSKMSWWQCYVWHYLVMLLYMLIKLHLVSMLVNWIQTFEVDQFVILVQSTFGGATCNGLLFKCGKKKQ